MLPSAVKHRGNAIGWGSGAEAEANRVESVTRPSLSKNTSAKKKLQELRDRVVKKEAAKKEGQEMKRGRDAEEAGCFPGKGETGKEKQSAEDVFQSEVRHIQRRKICGESCSESCHPGGSNRAGKKRSFDEI